MRYVLQSDFSFKKIFSTGHSHHLLVHLLIFCGTDLHTPDAELELL